MKILKTIFVSLCALLIIFFIALVVFVKTFDINKFKPQIVEAIQQATQKEVSLGELSLRFSFHQGVALAVKSLELIEAKDLVAQYDIKIDEVLLDIEVMSFLKTRQIVVSRVNVVSPQVVVVRKKMIEPTIAQSQENIKTFKQNISDDIAVGKASLAIPLPTFTIKTIHVSQGAISFVDENFSPALKINIEKFDLEIKDFFLDKPFKIKSSLALFSAQKNVFFQSQAQLDLKTTHVRFDDAMVETDLSTFSLEEMKKSISPMAGIPIERSLAGKIVFQIPQLVAGTQGLVVLSSLGELKDGKILITPLGLPLERIRAKVEITETDIHLKEFFMNLGSGSIKAISRIRDYMKAQEYFFDIDADAIEIFELLEPYQLPVKLDGRISATLKGQGQGFAEESLNSLKAQGMAQTQETRLVDFNLLRFILDKISIIPDLSQKIEAQLPQEYKNKLIRKDTIFKKIDARVELQNGKISLIPLMVDADDFVLKANGSIGFDQSAQFDFECFISENLSQHMASAVEPLSYLLEEDRKIHIPLVSYQGPIAKMMVYPDLAKLGKKMITTGAKEELKNVIFKALKVEDGSLGQEDKNQNQNEENNDASNVKDSKKMIINNVLDAIFK
ncbi:MAG TPA: AsmA family protein [Candidatus Omnitrophota bacterium]|nr:AsmA family protein [Candidatus Omnitrophota bacterium]